jgi:outer membrane protein assembly factor BamB
LTETNVYAVTHDGHLVVMDAKTGKVLKSSYVNADPGEMGMSIASPMVAGGRVYVGSETGGLRCYGDGGNGN